MNINSGLALVGLDTEAPNENDVRVAQEQLRETPELVNIAVAQLREVIEEDGTLQVPTHQEFLLKFLRPTKFYVPSAFALLKRALQFKEDHKYALADLLPSDEEKAFLETNALNVLVNRDRKGRRILVLFGGSRWDPNQLGTEQIFRMFYLIHQAALIEPKTQIHGAVVLFDFEGLPLRNVRALTPAFALKLLTFCQDAMPLRLKEVHIIRQPYIFNVVWSIFKPFFKEKLKKRIYFHGNKLKSLHEYISPEDLPAEFGGTLPPINYTAADWYKVLKTVETPIKEWNMSKISKK